ncbi:cbb3-type cytochrome c oxidase subunit 3 [Poseidonocella sp. HB161398]|uniref:cbb3-type cytochrome oxidase subunit 3 n=1 Tax=Poseidonocella sp. HB161398 TaxID=2320855 RepID=UPI00110894A5|nr:cbb3-type cytochrome c oxidase subunit 3 [Poseidonocella sp. HB161398]
MEQIFREIMDNFTLVYLFTIFTGICIWVIFGKSKAYRDSAEMIFRHDDKPAQDDEGQEART